MKSAFYLPVYSGNLSLALSTAESLKLWEPEIPIFFSSELGDNNALETFGSIIVGGEKGWNGKRYPKELASLVHSFDLDFIVKLDPDAYCLKSGGIFAIEKNIYQSPVIGSVMGNEEFSCGGVVAMRSDFILKLSKYPFQICEDTTRSNLLKQLGFKVLEIPEILSKTKDQLSYSKDICLIHKYLNGRKY